MQRDKKMEFRRDIIDRLVEWKNSDIHKPVLLQGARQIGKSWLMKKFGEEYFDHVATFNFDNQEGLTALFERIKDVKRILKELELYTDVPIEAGKTLIVFDEIQESDYALNSLKYFCEELPSYHIIAAGSLMGVAVRKKRMQVPVGKVNIMQMYPLTFREFLRAADLKTWQYVETLSRVEPLPEIVMSRLTVEYRRYMTCGGYPDAATALLDGKGIGVVDQTLNDILRLYRLDFAKYTTPVENNRINAIWESLPSQLAKENRKFVYKVVKEGAKGRDYEDALIWLKESGLVYKIHDVSKPGMPLSAYSELSAFKIYVSDCGLLRVLAKLPAEVVLSPTPIYTEFRGAIAENAVLQSIIAMSDDVPYYWTSGNMAEIDFIVQHRCDIVPIEVKADTRISGKSLSVYTSKYAPNQRVRFSMNNLKYNDTLLSIPLPLADWMYKIIDMAQSQGEDKDEKTKN